jgi:hypothetical protein
VFDILRKEEYHLKQEIIKRHVDFEKQQALFGIKSPFHIIKSNKNE